MRIWNTFEWNKNRKSKPHSIGKKSEIFQINKGVKLFFLHQINWMYVSWITWKFLECDVKPWYKRRMKFHKVSLFFFFWKTIRKTEKNLKIHLKKSKNLLVVIKKDRLTNFFRKLIVSFEKKFKECKTKLKKEIKEFVGNQKKNRLPNFLLDTYFLPIFQ